MNSCSHTYHTLSFSRQKIIQHLTDHALAKAADKQSIQKHLELLLKEENCAPSTEEQKETNNLTEEPGEQVPCVTRRGKVRKYSCKHCNFKATTKVNYWKHMVSHTKPEKTLNCDKCPFVTIHKHHMRYHMMNHIGNKPYKCPECLYKCVNMSMLNSHKKSHSNMYQYRCADCDYVSKHFHILKKHLRTKRHRSLPVLNEDGTSSMMIIDADSKKRGPRKKKNKINAVTTDDSEASTSTSTAPAPAPTSTRVTRQSCRRKLQESVATQTGVTNKRDNNNSGHNSANVRESTSSLPSTSTSASSSPLVSVSLNLSMFNDEQNDNPTSQRDSQTKNQNTSHRRANYRCSLSTLNTASQQQLSSSSSFVLGDTTQQPNIEGAGERVVAPTLEIRITPVRGSQVLGDTAAWNLVKSSPMKQLDEPVPLDLSTKSQGNEPSCQLVLPNLEKPSKLDDTKRRKGVVVKLKQRAVQKEDADEKTTQSEKKLCLLPSPMTESAPSTSFAAALPSSTFFGAPLTPSNSSISGDGAVAVSDPARSSQRCNTECRYCDISYPDEKIYNAHMRYHSSEDSFTCSVCNVKFKNGQHFILHIYNKKCINREYY